MSYDFWKTGGLNPGLGPIGHTYPDGIEVVRLASDECAVTEHGRIIARTFHAWGEAARFADTYRSQKRRRQLMTDQHRADRVDERRDEREARQDDREVIQDEREEDRDERHEDARHEDDAEPKA